MFEKILYQISMKLSSIKKDKNVHIKVCPKTLNFQNMYEKSVRHTQFLSKFRTCQIQKYTINIEEIIHKCLEHKTIVLGSPRSKTTKDLGQVNVLRSLNLLCICGHIFKTDIFSCV